MAECCARISFEQKTVSRSKQRSCGRTAGSGAGGDYSWQPEPQVSGAEVCKYSDCNVGTLSLSL